jgi:hypothetical protein
MLIVMIFLLFVLSLFFCCSDQFWLIVDVVNFVSVVVVVLVACTRYKVLENKKQKIYLIKIITTSEVSVLYRPISVINR